MSVTSQSWVLWLPVHDELVVQVVAEKAEQAALVLTAAMTTEVNSVPVTGTARVLGPVWGKA